MGRKISKRQFLPDAAFVSTVAACLITVLTAIIPESNKFRPIGVGVIVVGAMICVALRRDRIYARVLLVLTGGNWRNRHQRAVGWILDVAETLYGPDPFGKTAFKRCLTIAVVYPYIALLIGWVLGGPLDVLQNMPVAKELVAESRAIVFLVMIVCLALTAFFHWNVSSSSWSTLLIFVLFGLSASVARYTIGPVGATGILFASFVYCVIVVMIGIGTVGAVFTFGLVGLVVAGGELGAYSAFWIVVFLVFPVLNAFLDYLSLGLTRKLLKHLYPNPKIDAGPSSLRAITHILIDITTAAVFLIALALLLPAGIQLANNLLHWLDQPTNIEWEGFLIATRDHPFTEGFVVTAMLATTLVPTILHLIVGASAILVPRVMGSQRQTLAKGLKVSPVERLKLVAILATAGTINTAIVLTVVFGIWQLIGVIQPDWLYDLALGSGRWVASFGPP